MHIDFLFDVFNEFENNDAVIWSGKKYSYKSLINKDNIMEYKDYMDINGYQAGAVTFKWERSSDIDTHIDLNTSPSSLKYRLELKTTHEN